MRYYVFTPGSPGYISKELAVAPLRNDPDTRLYAEDQAGIQDGQRILSRVEALMVPSTAKCSSAGSAVTTP